MVKAWDEIGSLARLAPTPHNTQPFRIRPRGERAELVLLTERLLPREDHGNLYVASSFGTFAATLERAARHFGCVLTVSPRPGINPSTLTQAGPRVVLGRATILSTSEADPQFPILDARRT